MGVLRTLYLECNMGAAGDMLLGALSELIDDKEAFFARLNAVGIPGVTVLWEPSVKCGIIGTHARVLVHGQEEESSDAALNGSRQAQDLGCGQTWEHAHAHEHAHEQEQTHKHDHEHDHDHEHGHDYDHNHEHEHNHAHDHAHAGLGDIYGIIEKLKLPEEEKEDIRNIYRSIAEAEAKVHGRTVEEIHFHEVGTADAVADITGCVMLMHELGVERVAVSPINTGFGQVRCAHGILPVPAPAAAVLLEGMPCYSGNTEGELCTPTGAALLRYFVSRYGDPFGESTGGQMPLMRIEKTGYGMGKKDFAAANCLRAVWGLSEREEPGSRQQAVELNCNLDDMTPEELGYAQEVLLREGALEVFTTAVGMKKSRMGILLTVLCKPEEKEKFIRLLFKHTSTIGIREHLCERSVLNRTERTEVLAGGAEAWTSGSGTLVSGASEPGTSEPGTSAPGMSVRIKVSEGFGITREKLEYEDIKKIAEATGMSLREVKESLR